MLSGRTPRHLGDESGFTLIELLVAMVTGIIVTGALFAILEVSMHQTARVTDVTQANQLGRTTMTHIVDELHSACIAAEQKPIQVGSGASTLIFVDAYSEKAEIPSAHKDEIIWEEATGKMIDKTYISTGGSWPEIHVPEHRHAQHRSDHRRTHKQGGPEPAKNCRSSSTSPIALNRAPHRRKRPPLSAQPR